MTTRQATSRRITTVDNSGDVDNVKPHGSEQPRVPRGGADQPRTNRGLYAGYAWVISDPSRTTRPEPPGRRRGRRSPPSITGERSCATPVRVGASRSAPRGPVANADERIYALHCAGRFNGLRVLNTEASAAADVGLVVLFVVARSAPSPTRLAAVTLREAQEGALPRSACCAGRRRSRPSSDREARGHTDECSRPTACAVHRYQSCRQPTTRADRSATPAVAASTSNRSRSGKPGSRRSPSSQHRAHPTWA